MNDKPEIIIALVSPVGVDLESMNKILSDYLNQFGYRANLIQLSTLIHKIDGLETRLSLETEDKRIDSYMTAGDEARKKAERGDILAALAINEINQTRQEGEPLPATAHILRSLKHPEEVQLLRNVYGEGFYLVGIFSSWAKRLKYFERKGIKQEKAEHLINRDESEEFDWGQQTRDAFHLADVFIDADKDNVDDQISRFLDIIFGKPFLTPTRDEYAMFMAFSASLRSGDLARQVGAVISSQQDDIIATGANDVPRFGGGLYWSDHNADNRDYVKGFDTNTRHKNEMLLEIMKKIYGNDRDDEELIKEGKKIFKHTKLFDITEYGRAVHAEMEALLCCSRIGVRPKLGTLYCTTFPCHNCAKHIIASGISRVVFVEPYPKSQAKELHGDELVVIHEEKDDQQGFENKVKFEPFVGIGSRKFIDLFSMNLGRGYRLTRKDERGNKIHWERKKASIRVPQFPLSYIDREELILQNMNIQIKGGADENQEESG